MNIVLSLDIGTSKLAAVAADCASRRLVARESVPNPAKVEGCGEGRHEQDPEATWQTCLGLLRRLCASGAFDPRMASTLALAGQMHGVLLVDSACRPLTNLITWCDRRAETLPDAVAHETWPAERTGCFLHAGYGNATLAALAATGAIPAGARAMSIADYVAARLTGVMATDVTHAASWGLCDLHVRRWDEELVARLGLPPGLLPEIRPDLAELGFVRADLDLPPQVMVRLPIGDNQASYIGACGFDGDALLLNLGTGGQISLPIPSFACCEGMETRPMPFGGFLLVGASLCGGRAYAVLEQFFRETLTAFTGCAPSSGELYAAMDRLAAAATGELVVDTRFAGTRLDPAARGRIEGIGLENFTPGALARGVTRGMIRELAAMVPAERRGSYARVVVSGNAIRRNPLAMPFVSEAFDLPCTAAETPEEAAAGAAWAAAKAAGLLS